MSSKFIDVKVTTWQRLHLSDSADIQAVIQKLEQGYTPNDILDEEGLRYEGCEELFDTEAFITPEENDGECTIEVCEDGDVLWNNKIK